MLSHLADDVLSALLDDQLEATERTEAEAHLATCDECQQRLDDLRSVVLMLRTLPVVEAPRSFALGPRVVEDEDPPNVVRLRRWYTASRMVAGSLAAVFVLLSAGALYVDSRPAPVSTSAEVLSSAGAAQSTQARDAAKPAAQAPAAAPALAPAAATVPPVPAAPAAALRSAPTSNNAGAADTADQVAAATSVRALPTPPATPTPVVAPTAAPTARVAAAVTDARDDAAALRSGALVLGLLTVVALLIAILVRHRLQQATSRP